MKRDVPFIDHSVSQTAYMMSVGSCLNEILCTFPEMRNHMELVSHVVNNYDNDYQAVMFNGVIVAEFTIKRLDSPNGYAFEHSIKYLPDADKVRQTASLGDYLDILKTEN